MYSVRNIYERAARITNSTPSISFLAGLEFIILVTIQTNECNEYTERRLFHFFFRFIHCIKRYYCIWCWQKFKNSPRSNCLWFLVLQYVRIDEGLFVLFSFLQRTLNFRLHIVLCFHISENLRNSHQMFSFTFQGNEWTHRGLIAIIQYQTYSFTSSW